MSVPAERSIAINGVPCRIWEKGSGRLLVYLAGLVGLPRWTPFLDQLAEHRRVIAPSLPGFPGAAGHDRLDTLLDWIMATLDLLDGSGLSGGDLVGASLGGALAAEVAATAPTLVRRLVLIAPFGLFDVAMPPIDLWGQKPGAWPALVTSQPETYKAFTAPPDGVDTNEWPIILSRANEAAARLLWPLADTRLGRRLHRIRCPTLLLWGTDDKVLSPRYADRFAAGIVGKSTVKLIPGAGHMADLDAPGACAEAVLAVLE
jgi:pimeloyl-ACP methyl ester carboxylesterase